MQGDNNILDEIYKLESKLNKFHESDAGISFQGLDDSNFDLNRYIQINFTRGRGTNMQVEYDKISNTLTYFHEIQRTACEEIVFSIDQNFEKYIGISTRFEGLKDRLTQTQEQFHHFNQLIEDYYTHNTQDLNKLKEVLSTYEQVSKYEIAYRTVEDILQLMEECEKLHSGQADGENPFLMEDLKKASFLVSLAEKKYKEVSTRQSITADLESKFGITSYIQKAKESLLNAIETHFKAILQEVKEDKIDLSNRKSFKRLKICLESFSNLQASEAIERCLEEVILTPHLNILVEKLNEEKNPPTVSPKADYQRPGWGMKPSVIKSLYQRILDLLENGPLSKLRNVETNGSAGPVMSLGSIEGYNVVMTTWKSVFNLLSTKNFTFIFSVGIADNFNNNYKDTVAFLNSLSNLAGGPKEKAEFWNNDTMKRFLGKWSTSTYYQLRFAEIIRDFCKFLSEDSLKLYVSEKRSVSPLKETKTLKDYLEKCFNARIFNLHLSSKFLKLAYQMVEMYCTTLYDFYNKYYKNEDFTENKINLLKNITNELYAMTTYCSEDLLIIINEAFGQDIATMNHEDTVQVPSEKNQQYVQFFINRISELIKVFEDEISKYLIAKCETNLEFLSGISKKFRMTNRGKPTEPSNFLDNIFLPLGHFFQNYTFQDVPRINIEKRVVDKSYEEFVVRAKKILEMVQKEEETLSRYRSNNTAGNVSDYEKIKYQFHLDNERIAEIVRQSIGVDIRGYSEENFV